MSTPETAPRLEHPTAQVPRSVAVVSLGPSRNDYFAQLATHEPGFPFDEVWAINTGLRFTPADLVFVMDDMRDFADRFPEYGKAMRTCTYPIMTGEVYADFPSAHRYPIEAVIAAAPGMARLFHHNSIPYVLAYALALGVAELALYGCDYTYPNTAAREEGQAVTSAWVGYLRGRGVSVKIAPSSTLLETHRFTGDPLFRPFYGYNRQPAVPGVNRGTD